MRTPRLVEAKQALFLAAYSKLGNVSAASKAAGIGRDRHYYWARDPRYRTAFEQAHQMAVSRQYLISF
jgi:hypothetical protein